MIREYHIKVKDSEESFSKWKKNEYGRKEVFSLEEVRAYLSNYLKTSSWRLIKAERKQNSTNYRFFFMPSIGSEAHKNPWEYADHHVEIKIKPAIGLESILFNKTKNE